MEDPILEFQVLEAVHKNDGKLTQRNISERIGRSVASVNFALRLLAVKGYIKVSGVNARSLKYHLTPSGVLQKSLLAYNFVKRQSALYEEVRNGMLHNLKDLRTEKVNSVALYGWTPFTESAMLFLLSEGIRVTVLYVRNHRSFDLLNRIPVRFIDEFDGDCDVLLLTEPLPAEFEGKITTRKLICFPGSEPVVKN